MKKYPLYEIVVQANEQAIQGHETYQKFQCERCGLEQHMEHPNVFHTAGKCEHCEYITDLQKTGCNYLLVMVATPKDHRHFCVI